MFHIIILAKARLGQFVNNLMSFLHTQCKMVSLTTLPTEILENIISNVSGRPFHTELLLLNKALCCLFMTEQIRSLHLQDERLDRWITIITNNDMPYSELQYCNLLDKVIKLHIHVHESLSEEAIVGFIGCCVNLRILTIQGIYTNTWDISLVFNSLPSSIIKMSFTNISTGNGDRYIDSLVGYAKRNIKLETLYFHYNRIGPDGAYVLAEVLKQNIALSNLSLSCNQIGVEGARALAKGLEQNITLTSLTLERNRIGSKGVCALMEGLKKNTALANLNLSRNNIGAEGAYALAEGLKQNTALTYLDLRHNSIRNEGVCALVKGLKQNTVLTKLNLSWNNISAKGLYALVDSLKQNTALTNLDLTGNFIDDTLIDYLRQSTNVAVEYSNYEL